MIQIKFKDVIDALEDLSDEAASMRRTLAAQGLPTSFNQQDAINVARGIAMLAKEPQNLEIFGWVLPTGHGTGFHQGPTPPKCEMEPNPWIPVMKAQI